MKILSKIAKFISTILLILVIVAGLTGCTNLYSRNIKSSEKTAYKMGTIVKVKVYASQPNKVIKQTFDLIENIEQKMSLHIQKSEINRINKFAGEKPVKVSKATYRVVEKSLEYAELSKGSFDPTIAPVVQMWGIGTDNPEVPEKEKLKEKLQLVNYKQVKLYPEKREIFLPQEGMKLDVGGIAKGYAADKAIELFKKKGAECGFISLGGNVSVFGTKPDGSLWEVGIQAPHQPRGEVMAAIEVKNKTVVTSGNYERYFIENGVRYHHILNPKTGYPARKRVISSTIITDNSIKADALSTAIYVLGKEKGLQLINSLQNTEALLITDDNKVYVTAGIRKEVTIIKSDKYQLMK